MARVPVIDSPCPIAGKRVPSSASEHCSTCDRAVFNLGAMSEAGRLAFMSRCSGQVCVAYTVRLPRRRHALAAVTLAAAALVALPVAADVGPEGVAPAAQPPTGAMSPVTAEEGALPKCDEFEDIDIIGGVLDAGDAEWVDDGADATPQLPTIEDDGR